MNPLLTDEAVASLPLHAARAELLEEILSTAALEPQLSPAVAGRHRGWLVPVAAAAAVALVAVLAAWQLGGTSDRTIEPPVASTGAADPPPGAAARPLLLADGWRLTDVYEGDATGDVGYAAGSDSDPATLQISWFPARLLDLRTGGLREVADDPNGASAEIAGMDGTVWDAPGYFTAIRPVEDGHFLEIRGDGVDRAAFVALLGDLRMVAVDEFEASLPAGFTGSGQRDGRIEELLDGIARYAVPLLPAGVERASITSEQSDPYQLGADVASQVACAWVAQYADASRHGDAARAQEASDVLGTSPRWPVLRDLEEIGDVPEWIWWMADETAAGRVPQGWRPSCR